MRLPIGREAFPGNDDPNSFTNPFGPTAPGYDHAVEYDDPEFRFTYSTQYHVSAFQQAPDEDPYAGFTDLRGYYLNPNWGSYYGYPTDRAHQPTNFDQVNVESGFTNGVPGLAGIPKTYIPLVDHSTGGDGNLGIDDSPTVQKWFVAEMKNAFSL